MEKQNLQNKDIRLIGNKVLTAVRLPDQEIDRIVSAPEFFNRIRAGVEASVDVSANNEQPRAMPAGTAKGLSALPVLRWHHAQYASAVCAVAMIAIAGVWFVNHDDDQHIASNPNSVVNIEHETEALIIETVTPKPADYLIGPKTVAKKKTTKTVRITAAKRPVKLLIVENSESKGDFQAVTYRGETNERLDTDRVVRVELSRASLFAMGVSVPDENGPEKIKADLLIGDDGVMKGVRVEKE